MSTSPASGRRPPELDDAVWLRRRYERDGDMAIALDLRVSRNAVRLARERLGIVPRARGRQQGQRGLASAVRVDPDRKPAAMRIAARIGREQRTGGPAPSLALVATRVRAVHDANAAGDQLGLLDALEALGAASGLALDHLQRLEAA